MLNFDLHIAYKENIECKELYLRTQHLLFMGITPLYYSHHLHK